MCVLQVHGGTSEEDIIKKVEKAGQLAKANREQFRDIDTVLFFDEANTTGGKLCLLYPVKLSSCAYSKL